jgi:ATP-dependent DNA helicase RecQ
MVRVPAQDIRLSKETNAGRRERMIGKQQAMIHYAENIYECRIKLLLAYFGEENTSACGQCDVCLQEKSLGLNSQEYVTLLRQIRSRLLPGKVDLETLHQEIEGDSERTRALIRWLMDNDFIRSFGKVVSWNVDKERIQAK